MSQYMMRVEAVNLSAFILDTNDLSTIRGGGLLLLRSMQRVSGMTPVYTGGSVGLFQFEAADDAAAEQERRRVEDEIHRGPLEHATFMVDWERYPGGDAFVAAHAKLVAKNRWRQMRSASLVTPNAGSGSAVCAIDDIRPQEGPEQFRKGASDLPWSKKKVPMSAATWVRRQYGIEEKHGFYGGIEPRLKEREFVNDFDQLTTAKRKWDLLSGKMAVVYLDGNQFGKITRTCRTPKEIGTWSGVVKGNQTAFLRHVLGVAQRAGGEDWEWSGSVLDNAGNTVAKQRALRIETLQWGGDELVLVVPAWLGWWFLGEFFRTYGSAGRSFNTGGGDVTLSHGAGLVFCHHKAPIHRIWDLAHDLADAPKEVNTNRFAYQTLESFDHMGNDLEMARRDRWKVQHSRDLVLNGATMWEVPAEMERFRRRFPRNQLHTIVQELVNGNASEGFKRGAKALDEETGPVFARLQQLLGGPTGGDTRLCWLHIAELWDYTPVLGFTPAPAAGGAAHA